MCLGLDDLFQLYRHAPLIALDVSGHFESTTYDWREVYNAFALEELVIGGSGSPIAMFAALATRDGHFIPCPRLNTIRLHDGIVASSVLLQAIIACLRYRADREVHDLEELTLSLVHTGESYKILSPVYLPQLEDLVADVLYEDDEHWM